MSGGALLVNSFPQIRVHPGIYNLSLYSEVNLIAMGFDPAIIPHILDGKGHFYLFGKPFDKMIIRSNEVSQLEWRGWLDWREGVW